MMSYIILFHDHLRYMEAGNIRTPRHLLVTSEFVQLHPVLVEILRVFLGGGWQLWDAWWSFISDSFLSFTVTHCHWLDVEIVKGLSGTWVFSSEFQLDWFRLTVLVLSTGQPRIEYVLILRKWKTYANQRPIIELAFKSLKLDINVRTTKQIGGESKGDPKLKTSWLWFRPRPWSLVPSNQRVLLLTVGHFWLGKSWHESKIGVGLLPCTLSLQN